VAADIFDKHQNVDAFGERTAMYGFRLLVNGFVALHVADQATLLR